VTTRIFLGSENLDARCVHDYFVELIDGPHSPLYVHAQQEVGANGLICAKVSYCQLADAVGQPYHAQAKSVFAASLTRI